jgi:hypothetical protein
MWNPSKGLRNSRRVLGAERSKVLDDYIAVTWIPNRRKLQRHHRMEVRSMEENTTASSDHEHSSNKKCEDSVKPHHGISKTALTLDKNSRKRNGVKRQEEAEAAEPHALWDVVQQWDIPKARILHAPVMISNPICPKCLIIYRSRQNVVYI